MPLKLPSVMTELRGPAGPVASSLAFGMASALLALVVACHQDKDEDRHQTQTNRWDSATAVTHRQHTPLTVLRDLYAVCRLNRDDQVPPWAAASTDGLSSISRTGEELSIIVVDSLAPRNVRCERGWRVFKVRGPLPLNLIGIIAGLSGTMANAGISIFALSTFETDYVMVKQVDLERAERAFRRAEYPIVDPHPPDPVQRLPVKPVDEAVTDPEFFLFRARVQTAVATHDTAEIMRMVEPGILNSFGGDGGRISPTLGSREPGEEPALGRARLCARARRQVREGFNVLRAIPGWGNFRRRLRDPCRAGSQRRRARGTDLDIPGARYPLVRRGDKVAGEEHHTRLGADQDR